MGWRQAESGLRYRIAGSGEVVVRLESGCAVLADRGRLVYRRGAVDWSLAAGGRGAFGRWLDRVQRRVAGMEARMNRYAGSGEVGFAAAEPGEVAPVELRPGAAEVVCQAESLVAVEAGVRADVALVRRIREAGLRTTLAMVRLTGEGVAFLCAHGSGLTVELGAGEAVEAAWWAVAWYEATADYRLAVAEGGGMFREPRAWMAGITGPGRVVLQGQRGGMRGW
ncbi:MAG: AIM24 family protein [Gammaproteobacteria bacterium]|nr:AIM24 family protein [Gammaproteobacteria bacterium]